MQYNGRLFIWEFKQKHSNRRVVLKGFKSNFSFKKFSRCIVEEGFGRGVMLFVDSITYWAGLLVDKYMSYDFSGPLSSGEFDKAIIKLL